MLKKVMDKVVERLRASRRRKRKRRTLLSLIFPKARRLRSETGYLMIKKKCEEVFQDVVLGVRDAKNERIFRIGRGNNGKIRSAIVELSEVETKWELIKRSKCLKDEDNSGLKQVIIAPDLTRKEREENDKLREELKQRRQTGGRWIIRKGKVIKLHNGDEERDN